ncbi:MAG: cupin domain-containing protein, partial [Bacteroidales bacterium]|nr:cupin domain-containing protein [Bacteroidales bacterium]
MKDFIIVLTITAILLFSYNNSLNAQNMNTDSSKISVFPLGNKLPEAFSQYFIGQAYLSQLTRDNNLNCPVFNVTFEPGCRNNWHNHSGGQILIAVGGKGYYQAKEEKPRLLLPGEVVEIPADVVHWH